MERAYGEWSSPVSAETAVASTLSFGGVAVRDGVVYWLERRPSEGGRGVIVRSTPDGDPTDVTPATTDVRTLAHRYGGGAFAVGDQLVYSRVSDGRVCRLSVDGEPEPITPEPPEECWFADLTIGPDGFVYAVRERHYDEDGVAVADSDRIDEPVAEIVRVPMDGTAEPTVLASGRDFYSFPRPAPSGDRIAWTAWDHPQMPWDGTQLSVARLTSEGTTDRQTVLGGPSESVFQPSWRDEELYAVSDRSGWWNLYEVPTDGGEPEPVVAEEAEYGVPQWVFGLSTYVHLDDGQIAAIRTADGTQQLGLIDPDASQPTFRPAELEWTSYDYTHLVTDGTRLATHAGSPTQPTSIVGWTPGDGSTTLRASATFEFGAAYLPEPTHFSYPTGDRGESEAYGYYYPPTHPDREGADGAPPLIVRVHGGPTSRTQPVADAEIAYFTSRGFAVVDANYRGSTGYGRAYRDALDGEWGVADTADCVNVARYLGEWGVVDPDRTAIRGGSAGGYATLAALAFHDAFDAGCSYYGVADLAALAADTHKFESRYLDGLVGPLPEAADTYAARSPVEHAGRIDTPTLLLQGGEDAVVPPEQSDRMMAAFSDTGTPYDYVLFPDERHGFEDAAAKRTALETELGFYAAVFGLARDDTPAVELAHATERRRTPLE